MSTGLQAKQQLAAVQFFVRSSRGHTCTFRGGAFQPKNASIIEDEVVVHRHFHRLLRIDLESQDDVFEKSFNGNVAKPISKQRKIPLIPTEIRWGSASWRA